MVLEANRRRKVLTGQLKELRRQLDEATGENAVLRRMERQSFLHKKCAEDAFKRLSKMSKRVAGLEVDTKAGDQATVEYKVRQRATAAGATVVCPVLLALVPAGAC